MQHKYFRKQNKVHYMILFLFILMHALISQAICVVPNYYAENVDYTVSFSRWSEVHLKEPKRITLAHSTCLFSRPQLFGIWGENFYFFALCFESYFSGGMEGRQSAICWKIKPTANSFAPECNQVSIQKYFWKTLPHWLPSF